MIVPAYTVDTVVVFLWIEGNQSIGSRYRYAKQRGLERSFEGSLVPFVIRYVVDYGAFSRSYCVVLFRFVFELLVDIERNEQRSHNNCRASLDTVRTMNRMKQMTTTGFAHGKIST